MLQVGSSRFLSPGPALFPWCLHTLELQNFPFPWFRTIKGKSYLYVLSFCDGNTALWKVIERLIIRIAKILESEKRLKPLSIETAIPATLIIRLSIIP